MVTRWVWSFGLGATAWVLGACGGTTKPNQHGEPGGANSTPAAGLHENLGGNVDRGAGGTRAAEGGEVSSTNTGGSVAESNGGAAPAMEPQAGATASSGGEAGMPATSGGTSNEPKNEPRGFVVHEWGTNTVVSGSDGTLQLGLHHEEEDLPAFVYNRLQAAVAGPNSDPVNGNVHVKMETPVLYFYSDKALTVHASVRFPNGVFTQWYPGAAFFRPPIFWESFGSLNQSPDDARDPAMDLATPIQSAPCLELYRQNGLLDWGAFEVLAPGVEAGPLKEAPLSAYTWSYARDVKANALRFPDNESERFLFYRGLSNLDLPARTLAEGSGRVTLSNRGSAPLAAAFLIDVRDEAAAFVAYPDGVPGLSARTLQAPDSAAYLPLDAFVNALSEAVREALVAEGLYADESRAMVATWQRQWFLTKGLRVLYLAPQNWTEGVIPLTLDPVPDSLLRVMMVRVEVLTPELEAADRAALELMASDPGASRAHFAAAGRFAEPRLRRALAAQPSMAGQAYLAEVAIQVSRAGSLEQ